MTPARADAMADPAIRPEKRTSRQGILRMAMSAAAATVGAGTVIAHTSSPARAGNLVGIFEASGYGGIAVLGTGDNGATGVSGTSSTGIGVHGSSTGADSTAAGVQGIGYGAAAGVLATGANGNGLVAQSATFDAIHAIGGGGIRSGVWAEGNSGYGVAANSTGGGARAAIYGIGYNGAVGVQGTSDSGYGVSAQGGSAPLYLKPAATAGAPTSSAHLQGELYVDSRGALFFCQQSGTPGTWKQLA
jgi:hypothetical protein